MQSKRSGYVTTFIVALVFMGLLSTPLRRYQTEAAGEQEFVLHTSMENIGTAYRKLRRTALVLDRSAESLALLAVMQENALIAMGQVPERAATVAGNRRGKFILAFKRKMLELIGAMLDVEEALLDGDHVRAGKAVRQLGFIRKGGHEQFQMEED